MQICHKTKNNIKQDKANKDSIQRMSITESNGTLRAQDEGAEPSAEDPQLTFIHIRSVSIISIFEFSI